MAIVDSILMEIDQEAKTTQRVLDRIPEDKLSWKPHAKSMSLGQLGLHLAGGQGNIAEMINKDNFQIGPMTQAEAKSKKEIMDALSVSTAKAKEILGKMDDARILSTWTLTNGEKVLMAAPRIGVIRGILLNHMYHHRGQLSVYLRLLDVQLPSIYGPSADENPFV
jgi:uncharacterized damage-inducible protein DinB